MKSKYLFLILIVLSFFFSCSQEDELVIPEKPFLKILRWNWNKLNWLFMLWGLILPL